jgi:hypothetical protein
VRVVGVTAPVQLYEILDIPEKAATKTIQIAELFNNARDAFENRDWAAAEAAFESVLQLDAGDGPAKLFRDRAAAFRRNPPEADWDRILNLSEK